MPRVSVVLPIYNAEAYLAAALDSLLAQTFTDFEILAIDDGSDDLSADIIRMYADNDERIRAYHQTNRGLPATLNRALELATGEYVARMDADDVSLPMRLWLQVGYLDHHPDIGVLGTRVEEFGDTSARIWRYPETDANIRCLMIFNPPVAHPAVMIRRDVLRQVGGYAEGWREAEDYELWLRLAAVTKFANLPHVLFRHRLHFDQKGASEARAGKMAAAIRTLHLQQLSRLGVQPTPEEYAIHAALGTGQVLPTPSTMHRLDAWLQKLAAANLAANVWPEPAFGRFLAERWRHECYQARGHGWWIWQQYWRSRLRSMSGVSGLVEVRFGAACAWHTLRRMGSSAEINARN